MIPLDLDVDERAAYERALRARRRRVKPLIRLETLDHEPVADVSERFVDGTVTVDVDAEADGVMWSLSLSLLDPDRTLGMDTFDPTEGQAFRDRLVRVWYGVWVDELDRWVHCPIFTGPVTKPSREDGGVLTIEAQSKERLGLGYGWTERTWNRGAQRIAVIRTMMRELAGETKFRLPSRWPARLLDELSLPRRATPWVHTSKVNEPMGSQLYYDARGNCTVRRVPVTGAVWYGPDIVPTPPKVGYDNLTDVNTVEVKGATPSGGKGQLTALEFVESWHPKSPSRMGRGGRGRYLLEAIEDDTLKKQSEVDAVARRRKRELMVEEATVEFDAAPIPYIEPLDLGYLAAGGHHVSFRHRRWTMPVGDGMMTIGTTRTVRPRTYNARRAARRSLR